MSEVHIIQGDCLEVMRRFPPKSVNLILCDLPYGTTRNAWDEVIPFDGLWERYRRVLAPRGVVALTCQGLFTAKVMLSQVDMFKYKLVWVKSKATNFLNVKKQPLRKHEDICIFYSKQPRYNPQLAEGLPYNRGTRKDQQTGSYGIYKPVQIASPEGKRQPTDVIYFKTAEAEGKVWHPTQKPVELGRYLIRTYTQPGDIVLDNCAGSGSFLEAAAREGRNAVGIELNQEVVRFKETWVDLIDIMVKRLEGIASVTVENK